MIAIPGAIIAILAAIATFSALILVRAAFIKPRIGALTERAVIAVIIAILGVVYAAVALDTEAGRVIFSQDWARFAVRFVVVLLLAIPTWWTFLYLTGRLGGR